MKGGGSVRKLRKKSQRFLAPIPFLFDLILALGEASSRLLIRSHHHMLLIGGGKEIEGSQNSVASWWIECLLAPSPKIWSFSLATAVPFCPWLKKLSLGD